MLTPAEVQELPEETHLIVGEKLTVTISNVTNPYPTYECYIGNDQSESYQAVQLEQEEKMRTQGNTIQIYHQLTYTPTSQTDSGRRLSCTVIKKDDFGNELSARFSTLLKVSEAGLSSPELKEVTRTNCSVDCGLGKISITLIECTTTLINGVKQESCDWNSIIQKEIDCVNEPCQAKFGEWSCWTDCSQSCLKSLDEKSIKSRTRNCLESEAVECKVGQIETQTCANVPLCPPEGMFT